MKHRFLSALAFLLAFPTALPSSAAVSSAAVCSAVPAAEPVAVCEEELIEEEDEEELDDRENTAAEGETSLTEAILRAKDIFGDTQDYADFTHDLSTGRNGYTEYSLNWYGSSEGRPDFSVQINSDGIVTYYWQNHDHTLRTVIPSIDRAAAVDQALEFVLKVNPQFSGCLSSSHASVRYSDGGYRVTFYRFEAGVRVEDNTVSVSVLPEGGVVDMNVNMAFHVTVPAKKTDASRKDVVSSFASGLPFSLEYYTVYPENYGNDPDVRATVSLRYVPSSETYSRAVDAETGELLTIEHGSEMRYAAAGNMADDEVAVEEADMTAAKSYSLSAAEKKAVELQDSFLSPEEIIAVLTKNGIRTEGWTAAHASLSFEESAYTGKTTYWYSVICQNKDGKEICSVMADAETGLIRDLNVYRYTSSYLPPDEHAYSQTECLAAADAFLKDAAGDAAAEYRAEKLQEYGKDSRVSQYYFSYVRYANDVPFPNDRISVSVDPDTLDIVNYNFHYSDCEFPSPAGAVSADDAMASYWNKVEYLAYYKVIYSRDGDRLLVWGGGSDPTEKTLARVYMMNDYCYVDAFTGDLTNYAGNPFKPSFHTYFNAKTPSAVARSAASAEILKLADMNLITSLATFRPDAAMTAGELAQLMRPLNASYYRKLTNAAGYDDDAVLTREDAAKLLTGLLGYDEVAKKEKIFVCPCSGFDEVTDGMRGYVAIAWAFGMLDFCGDSLQPGSTLTAGEGAQMIYGYLKSIQ